MTSEDHEAANGLSIADVARVYREMAEPLEQVVRRLVCEAEPVVEDACQSAWCRLVGHRARVREETVFGWLAQTAIHEAFKLSRRRVRDLSLDFELEQGADPVIVPAGEGQVQSRHVVSLSGRMTAAGYCSRCL